MATKVQECIIQPSYIRGTCGFNIYTYHFIVRSHNLYGILTMIILEIPTTPPSTAVEEVRANKLRHHSISKLLHEFNAIMR